MLGKVFVALDPPKVPVHARPAACPHLTDHDGLQGAPVPIARQPPAPWQLYQRTPAKHSRSFREALASSAGSQSDVGPGLSRGHCHYSVGVKGGADACEKMGNGSPKHKEILIYVPGFPSILTWFDQSCLGLFIPALVYSSLPGFDQSWLGFINPGLV